MNDQQFAEARTTPEAPERADLGRVAHKIAWIRMNGSTGATNPFMETDPYRSASEDWRHENSRFRHQ
jgi:hypothetical protein